MSRALGDNGGSPLSLAGLVGQISPFYAFLVLSPLVIWYLYSTLKYQRFNRYKNVPEAPKSFIWGHLKTMGLEMEKNKVTDKLTSHPDYAMSRVYESMPEQKGVMALNLWPVDHNMLYITSHKVAEQLSKSSKEYRYGVWKSPTMATFHDLIGKDSILALNNEEWKHYRKLFNPGFAPAHLLTTLPQILSKTRIFLARLDELAKSGDEFEAEKLFTDLTFDIIGVVVLGIDLNAQQDDVSKQHPIVREFVDVLQYFENPFSLEIRPMQMIKRYFAGQRLERAVEAVVWEKWNAIQQEESSEKSTVKQQDKSVLRLALQDLKILNSSIARSTASQLRTFLFAGHDTTSSLLQWVVYELSVNASARNALDDELNSVFGSNDIFDALSTPESSSYLSKLPYTSAIIKETLRLYPPASSAKMTPRGTGLMLRLDDGSEILADEFVLYVAHFAIHRDPNAYGADAADWKPERWVGDTETSADRTDGESNMESTNEKLGDQKPSGQPIAASAWRPFERGPRNCIGQELANLEARIIIICMARKYIFEKVGYGSGEGERPLNRCHITSKPIDGMWMRVKFANPE